MDAETRLTLEYLKAYPLEALKHLETWTATDIAQVMSPLPPEHVAAVLDHCTDDLAADVLLLLPDEQAAAVIAGLSTPSAIGILRQFDSDRQNRMFALLEPTVGPGLRLRIAYPDGTAGSVADPRVTTLPPDISVSAALERVTRDARRATYYHYVVERDGVLAGLVTTKELLVAAPTDLVATVMRDQVESIAAETLEGEVLQDPNWRFYHTLPVVDRERRFLGALRYRTLKRLEEQVAVSKRPGSLPATLLQMWEAYALIGLRIMTDLAQAAEAGLKVGAPAHTQDGEPHEPQPSETA